LEAEVSTLMNEMITAYVPLDADGSNATQRRVKEEFMVSKLNVIYLI
jgi:GTPase Era involved in 16S rRNA processing